MTIKLKKTIAEKERYLKIALKFFSEIGFNKQEELIRLLNRLNREYVAKLLHALIFYQYCERVIDKKDDILRPVLLICLIDGTEETGSLKEKIEKFLRRLDDKDKLYLLNHLKILRGKRGNRGFRRVYHDLIKKDKMWKHFKIVNYQIDYQKIDPSLKKINRYMDEIAEHFFQIRNQVLHEAKQILYALMPDKQYNTVSSSLLRYQIKPKKRKRRKINYILSNISFLELRRIVKRGILKKISKK